MAKASVQVTGLNAVIKNLKLVKPNLGVKVGRNLKKAGLFLQRASQQIVPVDEDNLKPSAFTRNVGGPGWATDIVVGYTAAYAVYVHENLTTAHGRAYNVKYAGQIADKKDKSFHSRGENQQAKFLERPMRTLRKEMLAIIHQGL